MLLKMFRVSCTCLQVSCFNLKIQQPIFDIFIFAVLKKRAKFATEKNKSYIVTSNYYIFMKSMTKSPLQIARASYQPKLPAALKGNVVLKEGAATESVADQSEIKKLFPNTYGMPIVTIESGDKVDHPVVGVGVILSL